MPSWESSPYLLHPDMQNVWFTLQSLMSAEALPLKLFETYRTESRQASLNGTAASQATRTDGPHNRAVALDVVHSRPAEYTYPQSHGGHTISKWQDQWRTGLSADRKEVVDEERYKVWRRFGELLQFFPQTTWGGSWKRTDEIMGWDPYHVQLTDWRSYPPLGGVGGDILDAAPDWLSVPPDTSPKPETLGLILVGGVLLFAALKGSF